MPRKTDPTRTMQDHAHQLAANYLDWRHGAKRNGRECAPDICPMLLPDGAGNWTHLPEYGGVHPFNVMIKLRHGHAAPARLTRTWTLHQQMRLMRPGSSWRSFLEAEKAGTLTRSAPLPVVHRDDFVPSAVRVRVGQALPGEPNDGPADTAVDYFRGMEMRPFWWWREEGYSFSEDLDSTPDDALVVRCRPPAAEGHSFHAPHKDDTFWSFDEEFTWDPDHDHADKLIPEVAQMVEYMRAEFRLSHAEAVLDRLSSRIRSQPE